jgi:superfamily II DNA helicase RecQ
MEDLSRGQSSSSRSTNLAGFAHEDAAHPRPDESSTLSGGSKKPKPRLNKSLTDTFFLLLKSWRKGKVEDEIKSGKKSKNMMPWHLFDNRTILNLAHGFPTTLAELKSIEGMSKEKMSNYGVLLQKVLAGFPSEMLWGKCSGFFFLWAARSSFLFTCRILKR